MTPRDWLALFTFGLGLVLVAVVATTPLAPRSVVAACDIKTPAKGHLRLWKA